MTNLSGANLNNDAAVSPQGERKDSPSTFPAYPAYKDSGVEWLGVVPSHWGVSPLKWLAEQVTDKATTSDFQVGLENIEGWTGRFIETDTEFAGDGISFRQEDILFGKLRPYLAKVWLAEKSGQAVGDFFVLRPRTIDGEFLHKYILTRTVIEDLNASTIGAKMPRVGWEDMAALAVTLPPLKEQTQIARFLDHETARIDGLIEEQQRLIELLKEKRLAVISHAVTKGLAPTGPMKDSGVEWLGEVPAHWDVVRLKHIKSERLNSFVDGPFGSNLKSEHFVDDGSVYVIESGFATTGVLNLSDLKLITSEHFETIRRSEACEGDIIIAKIGARYGMCSILPWLDKPAVVSGNSLKLTVNNTICDPRFAVFVLQHLKERGAIEDIVNMTAQPALSLGEMNNLPFPLPSLREQVNIVDGLVILLEALDSLSIECKKVVAFAIERRSALISAAVTGKIDVRGWKPAATAQSPEPVKGAV